MQVPTILVVDDDPALLRMLRQLFERAGYEVSEAESAARGLEIARQSSAIDCIVSDVKMPGMDGLQFYHALADIDPALQRRTIFFTIANRHPEIFTAIEQLGVPMLGKLDDLQLLLDAVRIVILKG